MIDILECVPGRLVDYMTSTEFCGWDLLIRIGPVPKTHWASYGSISPCLIWRLSRRMTLEGHFKPKTFWHTLQNIAHPVVLRPTGLVYFPWHGVFWLLAILFLPCCSCCFNPCDQQDQFPYNGLSFLCKLQGIIQTLQEKKRWLAIIQAHLLCLISYNLPT